MNRLDRKLVLTLIAAGVAVVLVIAVIVVSILTNSGEKEEPTPTPTVSAPPAPEDESFEEGVAGDPESGSETIYGNDYSEDLGYTPLPDNFDPAVDIIEGTIHDPEVLVATSTRLVCEFSQKKTITERSLQEMKEMVADMNKVSNPQASSTRRELENILVKYQNRIGERMPADEALYYESLYCGYGELELDDHDH